MNKAFFLDRDGVINTDNHYVHKIEQFEFIPGVFEACRLILDAGYKIIIVTNQSGIGRGYYDEIDFSLLTDWMVKEFQKEQVEITAVYYCPHHSTSGVGEYRLDCDCRKPKPGMLLQAKQDHSIDLIQSIIVGDKTSDMLAGEAAGVGTHYLVSPNYLLDGDDKVEVVSDLIEAVSLFFE